MIIARCIMLFATVGCVASLDATAAESGVYVGAGIGQVSADLDTRSVTSPLQRAGFAVAGTSEDDTDTAWRLFAGYRVNPYLNVEAAWLDLGTYGLETRLGGANPGGIDSELDLGGSFNLGLVLRYPFAERFSVFGKIGALFWSADVKSTAVLATGRAVSKDDDSGTDLSLGLGLSYAVTEAVTVRADWDRYQIGGEADIDLDVFALGVQYQF